MTREKLLDITRDNIAKLPDHKLLEASDFIEFLLKRLDDDNLVKGIQKLVSENSPLRFLEEDQELYTPTDLKVRYK